MLILPVVLLWDAVTTIDSEGGDDNIIITHNYIYMAKQYRPGCAIPQDSFFECVKLTLLPVPTICNRIDCYVCVCVCVSMCITIYIYIYIYILYRPCILY